MITSARWGAACPCPFEKDFAHANIDLKTLADQRPIHQGGDDYDRVHAGSTISAQRKRCGTGCCGDSSDLAQASPISFFDAAVNNAETMGLGAVVCKDDMQCDFYPNPGKGPGTKFSQYTGDDAIGKWSVCIADATGAFTGTLQDVTLTLDQGKFKP